MLSIDSVDAYSKIRDFLAERYPGGLPPIICVVGPTATGKSSIAQRLAEDLRGECVSADSMQVYIGMDIGTDKVPAENRSVRYHCIDLVEPTSQFSVSMYQDAARRAFDDIATRGKVTVLVGGSGFYIRSAIDDYVFAPGDQVNNPIRDRWESFLAQNGSVALWEALKARDAKSASVIHPNNTKRVIRALEMAECGYSYASRLESLQSIPQRYDAAFIGLRCSPDILNGRIDARVGKMRERGLESEIRGLLEKGFREAPVARYAIGYKELIDAFDGLYTIDEAFRRIASATRRYAKRQRTWFRHDSRITWFDI